MAIIAKAGINMPLVKTKTQSKWKCNFEIIIIMIIAMNKLSAKCNNLCMQR
jgi:hypothetical protein